LATRSKHENCPFHLGFMRVAILVIRNSRITNENLLEVPLPTRQTLCDPLLTSLYRGAGKQLVISITPLRDGAHKAWVVTQRLQRHSNRASALMPVTDASQIESQVRSRYRVGKTDSICREFRHSSRQIPRKLLNSHDGRSLAFSPGGRGFDRQGGHLLWLERIGLCG
jgi:hypothetical protein